LAIPNRVCTILSQTKRCMKQCRNRLKCKLEEFHIRSLIHTQRMAYQFIPRIHRLPRIPNRNFKKTIVEIIEILENLHENLETIIEIVGNIGMTDREIVGIKMNENDLEVLLIIKITEEI